MPGRHVAGYGAGDHGRHELLPMREPPEIIASPKIDTAFAAEARDLASRIPAGLSTRDSLAWFEAKLRAAYPNAVVREQEALARSEGSRHPIWYASNRPKPFRIAATMTVDVPMDEAYEVYVDRVTEWQTAVELVPRPGTPPRIGRTYDATYRFLGMAYTGSFRIRDADPPRSVTCEAAGSGITVWYTTTFAQLDDGTRVTVQGDYDLPSSILTKIADRLHLERAIGRDIERANEAYVLLCASLAADAALRPAG
jgi:hypothetical protein